MPSSTLAGRGGKNTAVSLRDSFLFAALLGEAPRPAGVFSVIFAQDRTTLRAQGVKRHLVGLTLFLLGGLVAQAATYYVSPAGRDGNSGAQGSPFREIRKAISVSHPGDTVLAADGSYLGFDLDGMAGTTSAVFAIRAQGGGALVTPTTDRSDNRDTIHILFSSYVVVDGLRSFNANRAAVRIDQADHVTVRNGVFGNNATWGIFTDFSNDLLLENNECYASGPQHGIYVSNSGDRPVVRGNRVHDNAGCGIQLNADLSQGGDGLITGALIENNIAWNNGAAGGAAINLDGVQSSIVRNNLLYNKHASGTACFQGGGAAGPSGMQILNNTIDMAANGRWALLVKSSTGLNTVRNNILSNRNVARGGIVFGDSTDVANTDSDYNILDAVSSDDGSTRIPLAAWQAAGHEAHTFSASLAGLFVNPGVDYHLFPTSAAVDKGVALGNVPLDLEGNARPAGAGFDIGCYEYVVSSPSNFYTLTPCRILDTRSANGPYGGPALSAGADRTFVLANQCGIPAAARAVAVNIAVTQATTGPGFLTLYPGGLSLPLVSTINYRAGQTRANNGIVSLGAAGAIAVHCGQGAGTTHLVIDVNGYFQ